MCEPAACEHLRVASTPMVDGNALLALKALLQLTATADADVLHASHRSLSSAGGADATICQPRATLATDAVSSSRRAAGLSDAPLPILSSARSVIRGTRGSVAPSRCMRCWSSRGNRSVGAVSRRSGVVSR